ncbi:Kinesin heavy chain [Exophiala dermatitidis]|uniref:Kinesin-like protein n=1 Tax=Exophiala dermatitidis (strain ATCC 34100 / CBS 525.76 / NIH/UT8656) TaxID=858893 RepID=H6BPW6_EXODN|nr:kinesin family member 5 [Exophiala dermatitidis NIH/UT8656]EHY53689.1 kinesin family member 5 [Exophiala dermatitidis NIH/UT8656]
MNSSSAAGGSGGGNNIKVVARFRPQNKVEIANGGQPIVQFLGEDTCQVQSSETNAPFTFDRVFDMSSQQSDIFDFSIRSTVEDVMNGYNGTVFAYGQTGAGKSYTMMGDMDDPDKKGIIPRITEQIFDSILVHGSAQIEYTVGISYLEIYMERIRDLLNPVMDNLPINEGPKGPYVKGLREIYVNTVDEVYTAMHLGQRSRVTASTNMNLESSRSHSIFLVTINQKDVNTGSQKSGMLYLVDLAGSEKVGKTGASGQTLEEAKKINKSLSALGMVINALTDGKSTHVPYRDSKLTRILQESLGGNSRTTLIINCSPSSYNDAETVSTLRFGMRAKTIRNKAKINAELSPAELKRQLKLAQNQTMTFEKYIASLDSELQLWRKGETVPKEKWVPPLSGSGGKMDSRTRPDTPSRGPSDLLRSETPSRPDSRTGERSSTPSIILEKDEREEFLRRENELQDQLTERETQVANAERSLQEVREELKSYKESAMRTTKENETLADKLNKTELELQKLSYQSKEDAITMEALKDANSELETELVSVKQQLLELKMSAKETTAALDEKDRKKKEKMAKMMAGFDLGDSAFSENEARMRDMLEQVDSLHAASMNGESVPTHVLEDLRAKLLESQTLVRQAEQSLNERADNENEERTLALEERLASVQQEYQDLLTRNLGPEDVEVVKSKLEQLYSDRRETQAELVRDLRDQLTQKSQEIEKLQKSITELQARGAANGAAGVNGTGSKTLQQQIADFDLMKKNLMRDLQNRCERVVELEISLDETREQYNNVLRSSNNRQQQKKMAFLERNLEQLTVVQRQLVDQNTSLKKEVAIAERKLIARNERILSLESLLSDSQEKLTAANHRFEAQLAAVKERLEAAKLSSRNMAPAGAGAASTVGGGFNSLMSAGARIAKPLRGGGGAAAPNSLDGANGGPTHPALSNVAGSDGGSNKRSSWFFNTGR